MTFFDTNVLVYLTIDQDTDKLEHSTRLVEEAIGSNTFFISPLVLSEYIFILSKLKILEEQHEKVMMFSKYVTVGIESETVLDAYKMCKKIDFCSNINDVIHLKIAEQYCQKLLTFDSDFKKLEKYTTLDIEIIK